VKRSEFTLEKVFTDHNVADLLTKYLSKEPFMRHLVTMGFEFREGMADNARTINGLTWDIKPWGGVRIHLDSNTYPNNMNTYSERQLGWAEYVSAASPKTSVGIVEEYLCSYGDAYGVYQSLNQSTAGIDSTSLEACAEEDSKYVYRQIRNITVKRLKNEVRMGFSNRTHFGSRN